MTCMIWDRTEDVVMSRGIDSSHTLLEAVGVFGLIQDRVQKPPS